MKTCRRARLTSTFSELLASPGLTLNLARGDIVSTPTRWPPPKF